VGYFEYYPHFGVLTGEVRSAAAWPGMSKTRLNSDHTGPAPRKRTGPESNPESDVSGADLGVRSGRGPQSPSPSKSPISVGLQSPSPRKSPICLWTPESELTSPAPSRGGGCSFPSRRPAERWRHPPAKPQARANQESESKPEPDRARTPESESKGESDFFFTPEPESK
jgi:hypothetical protein